MPILRNTSSSTLSLNFWRRSRITKRNDSRPSLEFHVIRRACCVTHAVVGFAVHPVRIDATTAGLDEEHHREPMPPDRLHRRQIDCEEAAPMGPDELAPRHPDSRANRAESKRSRDAKFVAGESRARGAP